MRATARPHVWRSETAPAARQLRVFKKQRRHGVNEAAAAKALRDLQLLFGTESGSISQLYSMVGILVFIAIDGEDWVIRGLSRTYELVPMLSTPSISKLTQAAVSAFGGIFTAALEVAGPVLLALILTDVAFGVVSRVVPQLNIFAVGFPMKMIVGLLVVAACLPFMSGWFVDQLQRSVESGLAGIGVG